MFIERVKKVKVIIDSSYVQFQRDVETFINDDKIELLHMNYSMALESDDCYLHSVMIIYHQH